MEEDINKRLEAQDKKLQEIYVSRRQMVMLFLVINQLLVNSK